MSWLQVVVLSIVQGLTEFLPVSSSGHLAVVSQLFFAGDAGASFTAVTQLGTELAVLVYFSKDIVRIAGAWLTGVLARTRGTRIAVAVPVGAAPEPDAHAPAGRDADYRMGWYVIVGTIPICVLGFLFTDQIRSGVRNLWVVSVALLGFSLVIAAAEYLGRQTRHYDRLTLFDAIFVGFAQTLALVPGVSRSGVTISAGLFAGLDRELAARFGFLLAIPAVFASGLFSLPDAFHPVDQGMSATGAQLLTATLIAFGVGWAAVAWLLRFLIGHSMYWFVGYRVIVGVALLGLLATGAVAAT